MKFFRWVLGLSFVLCGSLAFAQEPLIADVTPSPYGTKIVFTSNLSNGRYVMRNATVFEMIDFAYGLSEQDDDREDAAIVGGPSWIDYDRFDILAKIPPFKQPDAEGMPVDPNDTARPVVKRILAERFHLKYHTEDRPLPGYTVVLSNDAPKLTEAKEPMADHECHGARDKANPVQYVLTCTSETIGEFVSTLDQSFPHPIVDRTGLTKRYDFSLKLMLGPAVHTRDDQARVYMEAFSKQLGLSVTGGQIPQPAIVVDSVNEKPDATPPEIVKLLPVLPDSEFEVASIRLAADDEPQDQIRPGGSQITFSGFNLLGLITRGWELSTGAMLGDALNRLPKTRFTVQVKLPPGVDGRDIYADRQQFDSMLQKLIVDRFEVKYHWGEWKQPDAYVLLGGSPKMKKADPNSRSFCKYGPTEGQKPARTATSPYDTEFHCQNVTMAQFADKIQSVASGDVKNRVPNMTGLAGSYDLDVYYTGHRTLVTRTAAAATEAKSAGLSTPEPVEGISLEDAFKKELGLRLEKQPLVLPALILDHFDQVPTDN